MNSHNKKICFVLLLCGAISFSACSKKKEIEFCEGVTPDGKGVNCGTLFEYGDITALIKSREIFGTDKITVKSSIFEKNRPVTVDTIQAEVKPDESETIVNIPLYQKGEYEITVLRGETVLAQQKIEIAD